MSIPYLYKKGRDGKLSSVTVTIDGKTFPIIEGSPHFIGILDGLKTGNDDIVRNLIKIKDAIAKYSDGMVEIFEDELHYNGKPLHGALVDRIFEMLKEGFKVDPMVKFLQKCKQNPSAFVFDELCLFLEAGDCPITDDGDFLAYKVIRNDWTDKYTGKMDNSVGTVVSMPRDQCETNRNRTCSHGLHFCQRAYIGNFRSTDSGDRLVMVKINPANVVSIPSDYHNTKGRACEYTIVQEVIEGDIKPLFANTGPAPTSFDDFDGPNDEYDDTDDGDGDGNEENDSPDFGAENDKEIERTAPRASVTPSSTVVNNSAKLDESKVRKIRVMLNDGWKPAVIAKSFGVHRRQIERIRDGQSWKHVV